MKNKWYIWSLHSNIICIFINCVQAVEHMRLSCYRYKICSLLNYHCLGWGPSTHALKIEPHLPGYPRPLFRLTFLHRTYHHLTCYCFYSFVFCLTPPTLLKDLWRQDFLCVLFIALFPVPRAVSSTLTSYLLNERMNNLNIRKQPWHSL